VLHRKLFDMENRLEAGEGFSAFVGKLPGVHGALMLILHLAGPDGATSSVRGETARAAARIIMEFILPHGCDLYEADADGSDWDDLRKLAAHVLIGSAERYTVSDLGSGVPRLRGRPAQEIAKLASRLVSYGWWTEDVARGGGQAWVLVPGLREALREQRELKMAEAAAALAAYREARGPVS
jgi:hypothetical protein